MDIPPKDDRKSTGSNSQSSLRKTTRKRNVAIRYGVTTLLVLVGIVLLGIAAVRLMNITFGGATTQDRPISDVLNMADRHQLKSVTVSGNDVLAISKAGQQYHAIKEDRQAVTEIFRHDGVAVSVDNAQSGVWTQGVADLLLIVLVVGGVYFFIRKGGAGGQAMSFSRSKARRFNEIGRASCRERDK